MARLRTTFACAALWGGAAFAICCVDGRNYACGAEPVSASSTDGSVVLENGLVKARFEERDGGVHQQFYARNDQGEWILVVESLRVPAVYPGDANKLFDTAISPHRYLVNKVMSHVEIEARTPDECVVAITGTTRAGTMGERVTLRRGDSSLHIEVSATIAGQPPQLEYLLSCYEFNLDRPPTFVHTPTLKFEGRWPAPPDQQVLGDRCFHSPAVILQDGRMFAALVPDLNMLNEFQIVSADARRTMLVPRNQFSVPLEPDKYTMPSALDLDVTTGISSRPVLSFGVMDYIIQHHVRYLHPHDGSMVRRLEHGGVKYGFDLFVGADTTENVGYQQVSRHIWKRYGHRVFANERHLAMPFTEYVRTVQDVTFEPIAEQPGVAGHKDTGAFLEFELNGQPVGGYRNAAPFWLDVLSNSEFWNNVRDAIGMYEWGQRLADPSLKDKAGRIINLALAAPQNEQGHFPIIFRAESGVWQLDSFDASRGKFAFITSGHDSATYNVVAMSRTCAYLLAYHERCEPDARILPYVQRYANWLVSVIDEQGTLPSYVGSDLRPSAALRHSAQSATSMRFLADLYRATKKPEYLAAAQRISEYLEREVLPRQLWTDLEHYFSCGAKPLDFAGDQRQAQPARGNLSAAWAAEGFRALWRATGEKKYLRAGEQALDYLAFTQCSWAPHFIYTAFPFGGFSVDNADTATFLDARQAEYGGLFAWYGKILGRQDLLERGVAAARSSVVLINHPRHKANDIYRHTNIYPFGLGPENIDHEGHPQSAMRTSPSWGEGSGVFTGLADILHELGGAYVDVTKGLAVGVDGVAVDHVELVDRILNISMSTRLTQLKQPWEQPYETTLRIGSLPKVEHIELIVNHEATPLHHAVDGAIAVPLIVLPDGRVVPRPPTPDAQ